MARDQERDARAAEQPIVAGLPAVPGILTALRLTPGLGTHLSGLAANLVYLAVIVGYVTLVLRGPRFNTEHGHRVQVVGQKIVAYVSMLHIMFLTTATRRALARVRPV